MVTSARRFRLLSAPDTTDSPPVVDMGAQLQFLVAHDDHEWLYQLAQQINQRVANVLEMEADRRRTE